MRRSSGLARNLYSPDAMARVKSESPTFKLETCLGEGLSSCVYKAQRLDSRGHSKQQLVLKILKNQNQVEWLRQEFEALSKIDSPHCVRMLSWENLPMGPALVLEYIEGISLFEFLRFGKVESSCLNEILAQVQLGLASLEQSGRFHGDLNLNNIMIDKNGCVKLIDFATSLLDFSVSKEIIGTPAYLAPEIWSGGLRSIKSDLFALGLIEYDLNHGLTQIPNTHSDCRLRAELIASNTNCLLKLEPQFRTFRDLNRNLLAMKQLGKIVSFILKQKLLTPQQTLKLQVEKPRKKSLKLAFLSVMAICCFVTPVISTPLSLLDTNNPLKLKLGKLEVRTKQWIEIIIDKKNYGYSPLIISQFKPGLHNLKWKSLKGSGEMNFKFESGELRILSDKDFAQVANRK